jgi:hypothetical protein
MSQWQFLGYFLEHHLSLLWSDRFDPARKTLIISTCNAASVIDKIPKTVDNGVQLPDARLSLRTRAGYRADRTLV